MLHVCRYSSRRRQAIGRAAGTRPSLIRYVFLLREGAVALRSVVEPSPQQQPSESEAARHQERGLPAELQLQPRDERKGHDVADRHAAVEDAHRERALANRKPLRDDLGRAGPVAGLTQAEHHAQCAQVAQAAGERMRAGGDGPDEDRDRESPPGADPVVEFSRQALTGGIGDQKPGRDAAKLRIGQVELLDDHGPQDGHRESIDEVDECGQENQADDPPAQAADGRQNSIRNPARNVAGGCKAVDCRKPGPGTGFSSTSSYMLATL